MDVPEDIGTLVSELDLGDARGGRKPHTPLQVEVVRELRDDDVPAIAGALTGAPGQRLKAIRHSHHQLAQILARGGTTQEEAALITGYDPAYISVLKADPTFQQLLRHYAGVREQVFVDVMERMKALGLSTLDELQRRLEEEPDAWARRELMEMADLLLVKSQQAQRGNAGSGAKFEVNLNFVKASAQNEAKPEAKDAVDLEFEEI